MFRLAFDLSECPAVFIGLHREHPAISWLEGITLGEFGVFGGDFETTAISEEILNWAFTPSGRLSRSFTINAYVGG